MAWRTVRAISQNVSYSNKNTNLLEEVSAHCKHLIMSQCYEYAIGGVLSHLMLTRRDLLG